MSDVQAERVLVGILSLIIGIRLVKGMSWEDKTERFMFRFGVLMIYLRGIAWLVFDVLGLFPWD